MQGKPVVAGSQAHAVAAAIRTIPETGLAAMTLLPRPRPTHAPIVRRMTSDDTRDQWSEPARAEAVRQAAVAVAKFAATSPELDVRPQVRRELLTKYVLWLVTTGTIAHKHAHQVPQRRSRRDHGPEGTHP